MQIRERERGVTYSATAAFGGDGEAKGDEVKEEDQDKNKLGSHVVVE